MESVERWQAILSHTGLDDPGWAILTELESLYSEPHRKYHNLQHALDCLVHLDSHPVEGADSSAIELAIWFHDAVYMPQEKGNEQASADMALKRLKNIGANVELRQKVHRLIMVTTHDKEPQDLDEAVMIDVDLVILGTGRDVFEVYESGIRSEYNFVPEPLYRRERRAILESFLSRSVIYNTEVFRESFEDTAHSNLKWAISNL